MIFGLLSYLEPVLLAFASMALGERVESGEWLTYIPIWLAVFVLVVEGILHLLRQRKQQLALKKNLENYKDRLQS